MFELIAHLTLQFCFCSFSEMTLTSSSKSPNTLDFDQKRSVHQEQLFICDSSKSNLFNYVFVICKPVIR